MRTAVVALAQTNEAPEGLALRLAGILNRAGHPCTLIWASRTYVPGTSQTPIPGLEVVYVRHSASAVPQVPGYRLSRLSEQLAPLLRRFDVVYSLLPGHPAMHALRERRFSPAPAPIFVTVVQWVPKTPVSDNQLTEAHAAGHFGERYQVRHSDYLACAGKIPVEQLHARGWKVPAAERIRLAGRDPSRWLSLHREVIESAHSSSSPRPLNPTFSHPALTVCVTCSGKGEGLEALLDSLARQKSDDFTVNVVADSSAAAESVSRFDSLRGRYSSRGWRFIREVVACTGAARNLAARDARSEYLFFLDSDVVAAPRLIERTIEAARLSRDDALALWSGQVPGHAIARLFDGDRMVASPDLLYKPIGNESDAPLRTLSLIRREVFEAVGGFPESMTGSVQYDALRARLAQSGYCYDVLPEFLLFRHGVEAAAPPAPEDDVPAPPRRKRRMIAAIPREPRLRLLMLMAQWPYPPRSPAQLRCLEMIRYLGARHDLTLVTFMRREDQATRAQLAPYCRSIYGVDYGGASIAATSVLPRAIREHQTPQMREAVEAATRHRHDVALIEGIFMASYRELIAAPAILDEHNIESALLAESGDAREAEPMRQYEDQVWPEFPLRIAITRSDRRQIQRRAGVGETVLVENGADPAVRIEPPRPDTNTALFFARFEHAHDVDAARWLCEGIWPHARRRSPALRLIIATPSAPDAVKQLATKIPFELIEECFDLSAIAARAGVAVAPFRKGAEARTAILNSMALGVPVVATSAARAGLSAEAGVHLLVRDDPEEFAGAMAEVLAHRELWASLRENGLRLIEERYAWNRVLEPLHRSLLALAASARA